MPEAVNIELTFDQAINYAFQQNAIPVIKELRVQNDAIPRKNLLLRITTEPAFTETLEFHLQSLEPEREFRVSPLDLKLSHDFLAGLNEKVAGWLKVELIENEAPVFSKTEPISLLARNEWCGLAGLPEILAAFALPNDPAVMTILSRAAELLREHTGRSAFNAYQDKSRKRAWEQIAAIYKAVAELGIRYVVPPASFHHTGQKVRTVSDILAQRFASCLDLSLLFAACCEQAGLHPLVLMHDGHAYAGCWLEERTLPEPSGDDLQHIRKLFTDELITVFECTLATNESPGTLADAELLARPHLETQLPFRLALDIRRARIARIHPLPLLNQCQQPSVSKTGADAKPASAAGLGDREIVDPIDLTEPSEPKPATRIDQWKSRLLDLSLRNRLLNFRETKSTIRILSTSPEHVEDELAAERELSLHPKPRLLGEDDPRSQIIYTQQQRADAFADHLRDELSHGRLHTNLENHEHARRLTELFRSARNSIEENGTNTLFAAVGLLEWKETEYSDRVFRAPLLLIPVELKRKSVLEGFSLKRIDEEPRLNVTLIEMLRQHFHKEIPGLDPLPEDESGVDVRRVFRIFRDAVRDLPGWEVKTEIWLGQFSFTKFLLWKDLSDRLDALMQNRVVNHLVNHAGTPYPNPPEDIRPRDLDDQFHPREVYCPRSADSSQLAAVMAAAAGHDFVLEGPPGTGKSQTIANTIAHCLAHGKRVLLVAEKRAALDVVYRRLREEGLEPFCLELHSNKTGKADVIAQFDRSLKFLAEDGDIDWEQRANELEHLRRSLNEYARTLHHRHPCGLSAYHCLDYLLPRRSEPIVRFDSTWPQILKTSAETLNRTRQVARLLHQRSRPLIPLADHPLALLACEEWSPAWAESALDHVRELNTLAESASTAAAELRSWLRSPAAAVSRNDLLHLHALTESLLAPEPVGPGFATTSWNQLSVRLDSWISLLRERNELRERLSRLFPARPQGMPAVHCESWSRDEANRIFEQCREIERFTVAAIEASKDLHEWLKFPHSTASRTDIVHLVALVDSLLVPTAVAELFATTPWHEWVEQFNRWIVLVQERIELRAALNGYDEAKLLALDLDTLNHKWQSARNAWSLPKWLRIASVRKQLRSARPDRMKPDEAKLGSILEAALRLRAINNELHEAGSTAESLLGSVWNHGEPQIEQLKYVREWGAALHERMTAAAGGNSDWLASLRILIGDLLKNGPHSYAVGTPIGDQLNRYRDTISQFDEAYDALVKAANLSRRSLDNAADHLSAVGLAVSVLLSNAPRLLGINVELNAASSTAQSCLGILWKNGEPAINALVKAYDWGKRLHSRMSACAGHDLVWLGQLRQLLASLFAEGPSLFVAGTTIGDHLIRFRDTLNQFNVAFDGLAADISLRREALDTASDHLASVQTFCERIPSAWPQIREWCYWQKVRNEGMALNLGPIIEKLESAGGETLDIVLLLLELERGAV